MGLGGHPTVGKVGPLYPSADIVGWFQGPEPRPPLRAGPSLHSAGLVCLPHVNLI